MSSTEAPAGITWMVAASGMSRVRHLRGRWPGINETDSLCASRAAGWRLLDEGEASAWRICTVCERLATRDVVREAERHLFIQAKAARVVERLRYDAYYSGPATAYGIAGREGDPERVTIARDRYRDALLFLAQEIEETMLR